MGSNNAFVMDEHDVRIGILLELEATRAQSRLQAVQDMAQLFQAQMRAKYNVPDDYAMSDWLTGFQQVQPKEGG